jgi:hypothetical protein
LPLARDLVTALSFRAVVAIDLYNSNVQSKR